MCIRDRSTTVQIALGDAIAITCMVYKKFGKLDFKKFHPSGSLSIKLKTVEDLMLSGKKIPFVNENVSMKDALISITKKNLGTLVIRNNRSYTTGILTDGDLKRINNIKLSFKDLKLKVIASIIAISSILVTTIVSILTGIPVNCKVAMTGEITLRGRVLPIGGLKEKLLAALRSGIHKVIIPKDNEKDLEEIPDNVKSELAIVPVSLIDEVIHIAFAQKPEPLIEEIPSAMPPESNSVTDIVAH